MNDGQAAEDFVLDPQSKTISVPGDAFAFFDQDPLRVLRACCARSQLGYSLTPDTLQTMKSIKMRLMRVPMESTAPIIEEMLMGEHVHDALMECIDVLVAVLPELAACKGFEHHSPYHIYDVWEHTAWVVQYSPSTPLLRWAALYHDIGKPGAFFMDGERGHFYGHPKLSVILARAIMDRLGFEPQLKEQVLTLVKLHDRTIPATYEDVRSVIAEMDGNAELFRALCKLKVADALAHSDLSEPRLQLAYDLELALDEMLCDEASHE